MTPLEIVDATAKPILEIGRGWMLAPTTAERGTGLGLELPFGFWVNGRAGVLGDVGPDIAAAAIGFMYPPLTHRYWNARPASLSAGAAARAYAEAAAAWGRDALAGVGEADLAELAALARQVADAAQPSVGALFAGWRALEVPADPAGAATVNLNVLREMRGGAHISAAHASGLGPLGAIIAAPDQVRGGTAGAERFGWPQPWPALDEARRAEAERMTSLICAPAYAALDGASGPRFVELVTAVRAALG
ncbi:MAG: hypothetical protein R2761_01435 [Acidimicrobiales bacterium]